VASLHGKVSATRPNFDTIKQDSENTTSYLLFTLWQNDHKSFELPRSTYFCNFPQVVKSLLGWGDVTICLGEITEYLATSFTC